jgi:ketosteroid isomerase-like protein
MSRAFALLVLVAALLNPPALLAHEPDAEEIALGSLADAELAFARITAERGLSAARRATFATDGVMLDPAPVRVHAAPATDMAGASRTPEPRVTRTPAQAGVSHDHAFGFTTGPTIFSGPRAQENGVFLAVWQREPRAPWKLTFDARLPTSNPVDFAALGAAPRPDAQRHASGPRERERLLALEADAFGAGATGLTPTRFAQLLRDDVRLYRDGTVIVSRATVATAIAHRMSRVRWTPLDGRISAAGDMALTYGQYREEARSGAPGQGYYAHLWLRDRAGSWRLAFELALTGAP